MFCFRRKDLILKKNKLMLWSRFYRENNNFLGYLITFSLRQLNGIDHTNIWNMIYITQGNTLQFIPREALLTNNIIE